MTAMIAPTGIASGTVEQARRRLYDAECALHAARQARVDSWVAAAANHLHLAIVTLDELQHAAA
jgi:hypothetical protein